MPLSQRELNSPPGTAPGCGHEADDLWFHGKCHLESPTWSRYRDGILTIQCARCERDVVAIHVAATPDDQLQAEAWRAMLEAFPGLQDGEQDVNGGDLVEWLNERMAFIKGAV